MFQRAGPAGGRLLPTWASSLGLCYRWHERFSRFLGAPFGNLSPSKLTQYALTLHVH